MTQEPQEDLKNPTANSRSRIIEVGAIARVEGEGALRVVLENGQLSSARLAIYEPPRLFESLLRGRPLEDTPDITARICGICPVAYQMTAVHALEMALGVEITPEIRLLRRLLYCGEWIESHGVHMHLLHLPDFLGCHNSIEVAQRYPEEVMRGLRLKKLGNSLLEVLGGRAVHPINVTVGGFYKLPDLEKLRAIRSELSDALDDAIDIVHWVAGFAFPDFTTDYEFVALRHEDEYPMNEGRIVSSGGIDISAQEFESHFVETQVPHSTALHCRKQLDGGTYLVGALSRINLNRHQLSTSARQLSDDVGITWPCKNPFKSIVARGIEVVHAIEAALQILAIYDGASLARIPYTPGSGEGMWATEAPRGLIYHRYHIDDHGKITFAKIVPPTSQNQSQIEADLCHLLPSVLEQDDETISGYCERLIRSHDPCISCATHFLKLEMTRG